MHRFNRSIWKAGIAIAGLLLFLVLMVWVPVSAAGANEGTSGLATPVITATMQATSTVDATVTTLQKEQLTLQVKQLQNQNSWLENNSTALIAAVATVVVALFGISQWAINRRDERRKEIAAQDKDLRAQAEERFQAAVTALGDEKESVQVGGAILLRSFLNKDDEKIYGRYYTQIFDLAVAYLRLPKGPNTPLPLTPLSKALIVVFKEAFPLARSQNDKGNSQSLDASNVRLDNAYLRGANLERVWMPEASLQKVDLLGVDLNRAFLNDTNFCGACLNFTNLSEAFLNRANLSFTLLIEANLSKAKFGGANLMRADLARANLSAANLSWADLAGANLRGTDLSDANLSWTNLSRTNLEEALSLKNTNLHRVKGLTKEHLEACKAKGAIIDEDTTTSPSQPTVSPPAPLQSYDAQTPSATPTQESAQTPNVGESSTASTEPGPQS